MILDVQLVHLSLQPEFTNVCFYYIPPSLRGCTDTEQYNARLGKVASIIKSRMVECGSMMIGYQPLGPDWADLPILTAHDYFVFLSFLQEIDPISSG